MVFWDVLWTLCTTRFDYELLLSMVKVEPSRWIAVALLPATSLRLCSDKEERRNIQVE